MFTSTLRHGFRLLLAAVTWLALATPGLAAPSVSVQASASAIGLALDGLGSASTHIVKVADVSASTNAAGGFTLSVSSGYLSKADGRTQVSFQVVLVAAGASAPSSSAFTTPSGTLYTFSTGSAGAVDEQLYIKYTPAALQDPGTYSAVVNLDVRDN